MIHWDPTISLGTLLTIITIVASAMRVIRYMTVVEGKVNEMYVWFQQNTERRLKANDYGSN